MDENNKAFAWGVITTLLICAVSSFLLDTGYARGVSDTKKAETSRILCE